MKRKTAKLVGASAKLVESDIELRLSFDAECHYSIRLTMGDDGDAVARDLIDFAQWIRDSGIGLGHIPNQPTAPGGA